MITKAQDGIEWLEFALFSSFPELKGGVFLRKGGVSTGPFSSLNASDKEDDPEKVRENRERIRRVLGCIPKKTENLVLDCVGFPTLFSSCTRAVFSNTVPRAGQKNRGASLSNSQVFNFLGYDALVFARQVHGTNSLIIDEGGQVGRECDVLITQAKGMGIAVLHADCQAAIMYDPKRRVVAVVHAGWRGMVANVYAHAVVALATQFGTKPEDLYVGIGPSLGPEHAEFKDYKRDLPEAFWPFQVNAGYFDLWEIARWQLEHLGIVPEHMEIARMCTYADPERFFSYRREKVTGRHATAAFLVD